MSNSEDREIAIATFNRAQELLYADRSSEHDHELLEAAFTSRHHWRLVGGDREFAVSDWLMSRIYVQFNEPRLAVEFALGAIAHNQSGFPAWLKASLDEGVARAYKCAGKISEFEHYRTLALSELALETDVEDVQVIAQQINEL
jgi:hypothetical protein